MGSVDEELDDIFGRITASESAVSAPPRAPAAPEIAPARPSPVADVPRPPIRPQPSPTVASQPAGVDSLLARAPGVPTPSRVEPPRPAPQPPVVKPQEVTVSRPAVVQPPSPAVSEREIQERIDRAVAEARAAMQSQIKDLQAKYQEQRQKWERLLSDLRNRNDDLHRQNQALEEELASLRERHRLLLQELSQQRSVGSPPETSAAMTSEIREPEVLMSPTPATSPPEPEISIGMALPGDEVKTETGQPGPALEIEPVPPEPAAGGEADDLMAELEALEKEMKNIGGEA